MPGTAAAWRARQRLRTVSPWVGLAFSLAMQRSSQSRTQAEAARAAASKAGSFVEVCKYVLKDGGGPGRGLRFGS
jgi:hypothetical protein